MEYPASKTRSLNIAFVVNADTLRRLAVILGETSDRLEYTVKFTDGISIRYYNIEEVIGQPNSSKRSIVSLIAGPAEHTAKSAYVNLNKKSGPFPSLEYTINGAQRDVIYFADKLDDWGAAVRQWYSPLFSWGGSILILFACGLAAYIANRVVQPYPYIPVGKGVALIGATVLAVGIVGFYILKLFPRGTFAIGHGEKRYQVLTWARNTVLVGLGLSVIGGVIANLIVRRP